MNRGLKSLKDKPDFWSFLNFLCAMNRKRRNLNPFLADANGLSKSLNANLLCYHSKYIWIMSPIFISQHDIKIEILQITLALKGFWNDANFFF